MLASCVKLERLPDEYTFAVSAAELLALVTTTLPSFCHWKMSIKGDDAVNVGVDAVDVDAVRAKLPRLESLDLYG